MVLLASPKKGLTMNIVETQHEADQHRRLCSELRAEQDQAALFDMPALTQEEYDAKASAYVVGVLGEIPTVSVECAAFGQGLWGPSEVAEVLGVGRATVAQWRRRYADFPTPLVELGAGRQGPNGAKASEGMPVWFSQDVIRWAQSTKRMPA